MVRPNQAVALLRKKAPFVPALGFVLGSGFEGVAAAVEPVWQADYSFLPGFPRPAVPGHKGRIIFGRLNGIEVVVLLGRAHYYEGFSLDEVTFPIRVLAGFGVEFLLLTNAAGGIAPRFRPGDFMCLTDHINWMGANPLRGKGAEPESRFTDLTEAYDRSLRRLIKQAAVRAKVRLHFGVYLAVPGPSYETPAEIAAFARLGADVVGMSTVPEVIVARQLGLRVAAISLISNRASHRGGQRISHAEVLAAGKAAQGKAVALLRTIAGDFEKVLDQSRAQNNE